METYDVCVVGAGMIGSATARHLSSRPEVKVCLIGPSEPKERSLDREIYGAYYDEARITRSTDKDPTWALLAQRSIERYRDLEQKSQISFYRENGNMALGTAGSTFINNVRGNARQQNLEIKEFDSSRLKREFPYFNIASTDHGIFEDKNAGIINPRQLVRAQQLIASQQGCTIINDIVCDVQRKKLASGGSIMEVLTEGGRKITCKKVLLATGAFTLKLARVSLDLQLAPLTVALVEVDAEYAEKLKSMPCVIYSGIDNPTWSPQFPRENNGSKVEFYLVPPTQYPDGRFYIKLGHFHTAIDRRLTTLEEIKQWYVHGNPELAKDTADFIVSIFKDLRPLSWCGDYCVITQTKTDLPYIDMVTTTLGVAVGGNGSAAKSSDEIGRLAADMILGQWNDDVISRHKFKIQYKLPKQRSQSKL